jgi:hypothetical protein
VEGSNLPAGPGINNDQGDDGTDSFSKASPQIREGILFSNLSLRTSDFYSYNLSMIQEWERLPVCP